MITCIPLKTITLHLCQRGVELYNAVELCAADLVSVPCLDTKNDCYAALRAYFEHRRGVRMVNGNYQIAPCPDCRVETYDGD